MINKNEHGWEEMLPRELQKSLKNKNYLDMKLR